MPTASPEAQLMILDRRRRRASGNATRHWVRCAWSTRILRGAATKAAVAMARGARSVRHAKVMATIPNRVPGHGIVLDAFQFAATRLRGRPAPLLEEERHVLRRSHRSRISQTQSSLPLGRALGPLSPPTMTQDMPSRSMLAQRTQQRLYRQEADRRRRRLQMAGFWPGRRRSSTDTPHQICAGAAPTGTSLAEVVPHARAPLGQHLVDM